MRCLFVLLCALSSFTTVLTLQCILSQGCRALCWCRRRKTKTPGSQAAAAAYDYTYECKLHTQVWAFVVICYHLEYQSQPKSIWRCFRASTMGADVSVCGGINHHILQRNGQRRKMKGWCQHKQSATHMNSPGKSWICCSQYVISCLSVLSAAVCARVCAWACV